MKPRLIVLEGFDRTGKDTLISMINTDNNFNGKFICYQQPSVEEEQVDYTNPEEFKKFMLKHTRWLIDNLYEVAIQNPTKTIIVSRMWLTDNVFSDVFNREHVFEKYFKDELLKKFDVQNYIILFKDYNEYVSRCKLIGEQPDFNENQFNKICSLFKEYADQNSLLNLIKCETSKSELFRDFIRTYII